MPDRKEKTESMIPRIFDMEPLVFEVGSRLFKVLRESSSESSTPERLVRVRTDAALMLGLILPDVTLRQNPSLEPDCFLVKVREIEVRRGNMNGTLPVLHFQEELEREISEVLHRYAHEFLGLTEVQALLSHFRSVNSELVGGVYPTLLSLPEIQRILQNLLREQVPIRDLPKIFETLREYAIYTHDPEVLTEYVRQALSRVIGSFYQKSFVIRAYVLDREIEQLFAGAIRWEGGAFLEFDASVSDRIVKNLVKQFRGFRSKKAESAVLLVTPDIRRFVRMLTERLAPEIPVLATSEIAPEYRVKTLGVVSLDSWPSFAKILLNAIRDRNPRGVFPGDDLQKALLILNLIGSASNQVAQCFSQREREALRGRAMIAPIPAKGKDSVLREFFSFLPKDKKIANLELLVRFADQDPLALAAALQKHWLKQFGMEDENPSSGKPGRILRGRDETSSKEKAAVFISGAARWVQEEVYRYLSAEDLRQVGYGMLQFPFISHEAKRKTWEDCESVLQKDEWWDPEALARFVQACAQGRIEEFKKRGFRQSQKVAILLLSLPAQRVKQIGKEIVDLLPKGALQQLLAEMGQWRDQIPVEAGLSAVSDFLSYMSSAETPDFEFFAAQVKPEVERIIHRDSAGAVAVMRDLWFSPPDPRFVFEALALQSPQRIIHHLLGYAQKPSKDQPLSGAEKASAFISGVHPDLGNALRSKLSLQEKDALESGGFSETMPAKLFREFLRGYYGGSHPTPLPFLKRN